MAARFLFWSLSLYLALGALAIDPKAIYTRRSSSSCQPFQSDFRSGDVSRSSNSPFVAISPMGSYKVGGNGLELYLDKPSGQIKTKIEEGVPVNEKVAEGATVNSTFTTLYGKISMELEGPAVAGAVTAAILIEPDHDEIDIELLGGDPEHWQSNVFTMGPKDQEPLYGVFGGLENYPQKPKRVDEVHRYTIDWNADRIIWSVDDTPVRTLRREETRKNGALHYPSHAARIQLGIWDASYPAGTSEWARGPINWNTAPSRMVARFKSVSVECPY
ncbi:glycoside hydrolase [Panus rudis PR-1116 ss-1]|nr:glycoside hydrolase [Panus rudis PR-1116 ss-1]